MGSQVVAALVAAGLTLSFGAGSAAGAPRTGGGTDAAGDAASGLGGHDAVAFEATYDPATGALGAAVRFASAPAADGYLVASFGTRQPDGSCSHPAAGMRGLATSGTVEWLRVDTGGQPSVPGGTDGVRSIADTTVTFVAANALLVGQDYRCAELHVADAATRRTVYDAVATVALEDPPAPPPPPAPAPTPPHAPAPQPAPAPAPAPAPRPAAAKRPALALTTSGVPQTVRRNRWVRARIRLANSGDAPARGVVLRVGSARGATVKPRVVRVRRAIRPGRSATATVRVRLSSRARATTTLALQVSGKGRLKAAGSVELRIGRRATRAPRRPGKPDPKPVTTAPGRAQAPLTGLYFWRFDTRSDTGWINDGIAFLDGGWAYRGLPAGGLPRCTSVTAEGEGDGCVRYRYDARTGRLEVGGVAGTYRDGRPTIGDNGDYRPLLVPRAGTRYEVSLHHQNFQGYCGLITGCTTWQEWLTLKADGNFALSSMTIGTMGGHGAPFTSAWSAPPDQYGRYEIESGARIRLTYADGRVVQKTIGVEYGADGRPDPAGEGLLLDDVNFYPDTD